jgi:hypothetical protein
MKVLYALTSVFTTGTACRPQFLFPRVDINKLPQTHFEATVYRSGSRGFAILLDELNDGVLLAVSRDKFRAKNRGSSTPRRYLKEFNWGLKCYRLQDNEAGYISGYLLITPELEWIARYNKNRGEISVWIEDRSELCGP